jgi:hypothetical protein
VFGQNDMARVEKEKKDGLQKIQTMHQEIRDLKSKLADFEANKAKEIKKLEVSISSTCLHEAFMLANTESTKRLTT